MRIFLIGDIFGKPGRKAVKALLPDFIKERKIDAVIANVENLSGGKGVDRKRLDEVFNAGVDIGTGGNHIWDKKDIYNFIDAESRLVRPLNLPAPCPGKGWRIFRLPNLAPIAVINMLGRVYMTAVDCPFQALERALAEIGEDAKIIIVDFHAEATSEKIALTERFAHKTTAIVGTHTHVQTADERITKKGAAAMTDLGMSGPHESVIGMRYDRVLERFLTARPVGFQVATGGVKLQGAILEADEKTGKALSIQRISMEWENK